MPRIGSLALTILLRTSSRIRYSSIQGRFTSPDEFKGEPDELFVLGSGDTEKQTLPYADIANPQSLHKYQYCLNNPLRYVDPDGHQETPKKKGVVESVKDYISSIIRPAMKQGGQQEEDAWDNEGRQRGTAPVVIDGAGAMGRHADALRQGMEVVNKAIEVADPSGGVGVLHSAIKGDKTGVALGIAGMLFNKGGGNVTLGEAKRLVSGWARDPVKNTVSASIKYHFSEHATELGARNLGQYLRKAEAFARNLKGIRPTSVPGRTEGVMRYRRSGKYIDIDSNGKIVSFGAIR